MSVQHQTHVFHPIHDEFMDQDMQDFWYSLGPCPGDLRLYGGTALALYLNHRQSTDFDFATPLPVVNVHFVSSIHGISKAHLSGGDGMVDGVLKAKSRDIRLTFMECGTFLPIPTEDPITAKNGILIAHPADLVVSKAHAMCSRGLLRDYQDLIASFNAWPELCVNALQNTPVRSSFEIARSLSAPPIDVCEQIDPKDRAVLARLARDVAVNDQNLAR